jgi:hypothetical protein
VSTTVREANDRGYDCLIAEDCVASYFPEFHKSSLEMTKAQGGIFGWVSESKHLLGALEKWSAEPSRRDNAGSAVNAGSAENAGNATVNQEAGSKGVRVC